MSSSGSSFFGRQKEAIILGLVFLILGTPLAWSGLNDWRPFRSGGNVAEPAEGATPGESGTTTSGGVVPQMLTPDSPVKVRWLGTGDTLEVSWGIIDDPELDHYSVNVYALYPIEDDYNVGYRFGEELRLTDTTSPISEMNEHFAQQGDTSRVTAGQSWRICVQGMRETPGGVSITPYIIVGSNRCSDIFTIPQ